MSIKDLKTSKYWNHRVLGLILSLSIVLSSIYHVLINKIVTFIYKYGLGKIGNNVTINRGFICRYPGNLNMGDNVIIDYDVEFFTEDKNSSLLLSKNVSIGRNTIIDFTGGIEMGEYTHIAAFSYILTHDHGYDPHDQPIGKKLIISDHVFIGIHSIILSNVSYIGSHAVIGAGSIVTKDVPDYTVVVGKPANIIKYRL